MKHWFKFIVKGADGTYEGTEFVKAETEQEAIADIKDNWIDYPYTDDVEECTFEPDCLSYKEQDECIRKDAVEAFMADGCTKDEAERHIKNGGEAILAKDWNQYAQDNGLDDKPEDIIKAYNAEGSIKKVAALFSISEQKVRKVLIDAGAYESDMSIQVNDLHEQGYSVENIAEKLRVSKSTVSAYLPYTKGVYLGENPSSNALKIRKCRAKNG